MDGSNQNLQNQTDKPVARGRGRGFNPSRAVRGQNMQWRGKNMAADFRTKPKRDESKDQKLEPQTESPQQTNIPTETEESKGTS